MKSNEARVGYQLQKKFLANKKISAYKVGASNFRSSDFFGFDGILLGGIENQCIFYHDISKDYPVAEVEVVAKVSIDSQQPNGYQVEGYYLGLECPFLVVDNPEGSPFVCLADNCAAGDLILFQKIDDPMPSHVDVLVNGKTVCEGSYGQMKYSVSDILDATVKLLFDHELPYATTNLYIATGGLTEVFSLKAGDQVSLHVK